MSATLGRNPAEFVESVLQQAQMLEAERRYYQQLAEQLRAGLADVRQYQNELRTMESATPILGPHVKALQQRIVALEGLVTRIATMTFLERLAWLVWAR